MKWRILTLSLFLCAFAFGQKREVILKRVLKVDCPNQVYHIERCHYALMIPVNRPGRQEVITYTYPAIQPAFVNRNEKNETFLNWKDISFGELKKSVLQVDMKIRIQPYDLKTAKKSPKPDKKDMDTLSYLKDEENFRCEAKNIQEAAAKIEGTSREEIVKNIFEFVGKSLDYKSFFFQDRGAKQALKDGQGDCTEYSELMITLCRAKKIPARIVMGLIVHSNGLVDYHNWAEVYFPEYGWVSFDPTWADGPSANTSFYKMKNCYIQLSNLRFTKQIIAPCYGDFPFSIDLRDSCVILSHDIAAKDKQMQAYYHKMQLGKADSLLDTLLVYEPDQYSYWMFKGIIKARQGDFEKALACLRNSEKSLVSLSEKKSYLYALANYYALKNEADSAVKTLKESYAISPIPYVQANTDPDLIKIRYNPAFMELLAEWKRKEDEKSKKKD